MMLNRTPQLVTRVYTTDFSTIFLFCFQKNETDKLTHDKARLLHQHDTMEQALQEKQTSSHKVCKMDGDSAVNFKLI